MKAQGLINAAKWVEQERGAAALAEVLAECSEPVRVRYMTGAGQR